MSFRYQPILLAALAMTSSASAQPAAEVWASAHPMTITLSSFKYEPAQIALTSGAAYVFHFQNTSSGGHDFEAKSFFDRAQIMPADRPKVVEGKVALSGGESTDIHLIAPAAATFNVRCTHFMHKMFGMTGQIVVR